MMLRGSGRRVHKSAASGDSVEVSEADGIRTLHLGSPTVQSAMRLAAPDRLELAYTRGMLCFLLFHPQARDILCIGLGGGAMVRFIHSHLPQLHVRTVEISPRVIAVARSHFHLPQDDARTQVIEGDGAHYVREHPGTADVLIVDAFDGRGIPPDLCSQDFFDQSAATLRADGMLAINLWGSDRNFDLYLHRIERSFDGRVLRLPTGRPGNIVVFAFNAAARPVAFATLLARAREGQAALDIEFLEFVARLRDNQPGAASLPAPCRP